ncbi:hypothetical protein GCM10019016_120430 [Streptomyces prasinosporus]|uniref:Major facilitator superfamily (MFS) profile domain-containing protein n=1 Tax=Streptomyces prasinosporus TaxID=68256 RepID=A0ABP6UCK2_9ACTN
MFIHGSVLPYLLGTKTFGVTPDQAGDLGSHATFGMPVGALTAGTVADRTGRKKLMVACVALFSLASAVCAVADGVAVLGLGRTLAGIGLGGQLLAVGHGDRGFTAFAPAGVSSTVFIGVAALRGSRQGAQDGPRAGQLAAH